MTETNKERARVIYEDLYGCDEREADEENITNALDEAEQRGIKACIAALAETSCGRDCVCIYTLRELLAKEDK